MSTGRLLRDPVVRAIVGNWLEGTIARRELFRGLGRLGLGAAAASAVIGAFGESGMVAAAQSFKGQTLVVTSYGGRVDNRQAYLAPSAAH